MTRRDYECYYIDQAQSYFSRTKSLDSSVFLLPFTNKLSINDPVLDLGCGSGRDLLWLKNMGFQPVGFERSPELARLAQAHSGCQVIQGDYCTFDFSSFAVKGILFSASLVHLPHDQVEMAIVNALQAMKQGGFVYISLKKGHGIRIDKNRRIFYLWEDGDVRMLFDIIGLDLIDFQETLSVADTGETWLSYCLRYEQKSINVYDVDKKMGLKSVFGH